MPDTGGCGRGHEGPSRILENTGDAGPGSPEKEIIRRIRLEGSITFAEFMEIALYWPEGGYYSSDPAENARWGGSGDYITSIDISPVFSRLIARQVSEMWAIMGRPEGFRVVEAGAGRGWLSKGIYSALEELCPELYGSIRFHLIEKNPYLREDISPEFVWHHDISEVLPGISGCIISNELIDSFPVHRIIEDGGIKELYVGLDGETFIDAPGPPSTPEVARYLEDLGITLPPGCRTEVNLAAGRWIKAAGEMLDRGFVITIDYGLPARELYSPERKGTLMCHYRHTLNDNPYIHIGSQDITTHVDFTALACYGRREGLGVTGFTTQKNFLLGLGILDEMREPIEIDLGNYDKIRHNQLLKELIMPGGMGDTFKVLIQHKGLESPELKGFSFRDMKKFL